uniref:DUF5110 domain-containing protein n=1 Tax=Mucochytrium quahogii TaxID=96639 RepID=A0A7S2WIU5_9STRA|mmetsp:Transcript_19849/g.32626  ORF Transcript_19849/g.32626 Transcript_19849/m.32626 type:complete len:884 (+) Transcript_19849:555-3206(+)|eukprot:CAMPEP_0203750720 /NCGR_PEP_ID=MMETSP0098-20131031/4909_1 /ASSEMBLY_ACC=CAM_ASM_000208 /TAXON_ID=96639 /ORGANISM=" , Strain NY0313808BC1" /LENGTH=883 /DNA_ID=CAMNT_0050640143 /DNA_START=58 /DNA_END=2709 /DNA_ORIENTATION=-
MIARLHLITLLLLFAISNGQDGRRDGISVDEEDIGATGPGKVKELLDYKATARDGATVEAGSARFTVLTDRMIRMEQDLFLDEATLTVVHRDLLVPDFESRVREDKVLEIRTSHLLLEYRIGMPFRADTLQIKSLKGDFSAWKYGDKDKENLLGTIRSLDKVGPIDLNCSSTTGTRKVSDESLHCAWGVVSRAGWSVVDDSDGLVIDPVSGWWKKPVAHKDLYFMGYGLSFKDAIQDFTRISGKPAMVPRNALGVWWTRWYQYSEADLMEIVEEFKLRSIPLDVLVLDMNWHTKPAWGGYSWDRALWPFPEETLDNLKRQGISTLANLHDNDGVVPANEAYEELASYLGVDNGTTIPFASCADQKIALGLEDIVLDRLKGLDYWWVDWQQGGSKGGCTGGRHNPTIWLNRLRGTNNIRKGSKQRDMVLGRWGGLGNHRYQVGFSGDVDKLEWSRLAFQPYFTMTAANVAYGMWSHDITGPQTNPELTMRWIQWGVYSPIIRFHERGLSAGPCSAKFMGKNTCSIGQPWDLPGRYYKAVRKSLRNRLRLLPYLYNGMRRYFDTGLSLLLPMYYEYPEEKMAYAANGKGEFPQYMFGADMMVSPIVAAANNGYLATQKVWIPPGRWIEQYSGRTHNGPKIISVVYDTDDVPVFIRAGAIVPTLDISRSHGVAARQYDHIELVVYLDPSVRQGFGHVYLDDGSTRAYLEQGGHDKVVFEYTYEQETLQFKITTPSNHGLKTINVRLFNVAPLEEHDDELQVSYDTDDFSVNLLFETPPMGPTVIHSVKTLPTLGFRGLFESLSLVKRELDTVRATDPHGALLKALASRFWLGTYAKNREVLEFEKLLATVTSELYTSAMKEVGTMSPKLVGKKRLKYVNELLKRYS